MRQCQKLIFEAYYGELLRIAFRYVSTYEQAVEITHCGLLKIFHELILLRMNQYGIFKVALSRLIKSVFIITIDGQIKSELGLHVPWPIPGELWKQQDTVLSETEFKHIELIKILKGLPISHRLVFNLYVIDGFPHSEIAKMLGITVKDSKYKLIEARKYCYGSLVKGVQAGLNL